MAAKHDKLLILLTVLVFIFSLVAFFGVGIFIASTDENGGLANILDKYVTKLSPPVWSYAIWFVIGLWQTIWVIYVFTTMCRYTEMGPMYRNPPVISKLFMWSMLVALVINCVAFLFLINDWLLLFVIFMLGLWFTLSLALVYLHVRLDEYWVLLGLKYREELISLIILVQNGVAFYASVTAIFSTAAICSGGVYVGGLSLTSSSCLAVAIFFILLVAYFVLEVTLWDRYLRFTFSVYPAIIWTLLVTVIDKWEPWNASNGLTLVLLIISAVMFLIKLIVVIVRQKKDWSLYVEGRFVRI
ncbi:hypothetical protein BSL78_20104 [Apostichopus japonicus]|uniref:Uncharacterized protein n=1 Tax=Stichopus japonicus TaxID=307972 RepID=A0A2G8K4V7_STIJA|nr:hypothetical protein BSL78_20104 [Apostichopus japonicus]